MLLSPVEHTVPKRYSGLELRMYEPTPVFSFPYKSTHHIIPIQTQDCGHGGGREVILLRLLRLDQQHTSFISLSNLQKSLS